MARRRLEAAIQAGKAIERGDHVCNSFQKIASLSRYQYDAVKDGVYSLQYSYDGNLLAVGYGDGCIEVLSSHNGLLHREVRKHRQNSLAITCIRFSPANQDVFLASSADGKIYQCNIAEGTCKDAAAEPGNEINCLDFCLDGDRFASAGKDLDVRIYDSRTNKCMQTYEGFQYISPDHTHVGHAQRVFALKYHPETNYILVTGGWDNHLKVWDTRTSEGVVRTIHGPHICGDGLDLKGTQVLTGSWVAKDALQLWEFGEGTLLETLPYPSANDGEFIYCAQFAENNVVLAGGSGTNSVQAVNLITKEVLGEVNLGHPTQALDHTRGGQMFAMGGGGCYLKLGALS